MTRFSVAQQMRPAGQSAALEQMALPTNGAASPPLDAAAASMATIAPLEPPYELPPLLDDPLLPLEPALASSEAEVAPASSP